MTMEVKTIREGGNNGEQIRLTGPLSYGTLTLKRGMTASFDLWDWMSATLGDSSLRAKSAEVAIFAGDGNTEQVRFILKRCLPVKLKAPALNAKDGIVAIEELQLAYESLTLRRPAGGAQVQADRNKCRYKHKRRDQCLVQCHWKRPHYKNYNQERTSWQEKS